jgi:hypothetical protein
MKSAFVCRAKNAQEHRNFDGAGSMEPPVTTQGKSQTALEIVHRHCDSARLASRAQSLHFLIEPAGKIDL